MAAVALKWDQVASWRMARHLLAEPAEPERMLEVVSRIFCVQAQMMSAAELAIGARTAGVGPEQVREALWERRTLVKSWAMRGTLHLIAAEELPLYVASLRTRQHFRKPIWLRYNNLKLEELEAIIAAIREALDGKRLTREQLADEVGRLLGSPRLGEMLRSGWGSMLKPAAYQGNLCFGPSQGQAVTFVRPDQWLGGWREVESEEAHATLLRRFLGAYGPATRDEFARWCGMEPRDAKQVFAGIAGELAEVMVEGQKGFVLAADVDEMRLMEPLRVVRLLPNFDQYTIAFYPRAGYLPGEDFKERVYRKGAWVTPAVLVDGRIEGVWKQEKGKNGIGVTVEMFVPPDERVKKGVAAEAERLGALLGAQARVEYGVV